MKKLIKKNDDLSPMIKRTCEALKRVQKRREERLKNLRSVYGYKDNNTGLITDNMILLDYSSELAHKHYLEKHIYSLFTHIHADRLDGLAHLSVVRLGKYDKIKNEFMRINPKVIFNIVDIINVFKESAKKNEK